MMPSMTKFFSGCCKDSLNCFRKIFYIHDQLLTTIFLQSILLCQLPNYLYKLSAYSNRTTGFSTINIGVASHPVHLTSRY
jgi:hypothetical protein